MRGGGLRRGVLRCAGGGYLVAAAGRYFYVTEGGRVYHLRYVRRGALERAVCRLISGGGAPPGRLVEVDPSDDYWRRLLQRVAAALGRERPDLVPVIPS